MRGSLDPGSTFAGFVIESQLGRGGMSVVYLAEHVGLGRKVALKILAPELAEDSRFRERFVRESKLAASIDHPHVIPIYEAGEKDDVLYIAMRFVDGIDLKQLVRQEGHLDAQRSVAIITQVGSALDAAHARGLIHRDVKPANILVIPGGSASGGDHVYLADFGLTKHSTSHSSLTMTGQFVGTIDYIAPEQIEGKDVDGRADIYALGCVLYECLIGIPPFRKDSDIAVIYAHLRDDPPAVTARRPDLPPAIDRVVATAMAKDPADRFATGAALAAGAAWALRDQPLQMPAQTPETATGGAPLMDQPARHGVADSQATVVAQPRPPTTKPDSPVTPARRAPVSRRLLFVATAGVALLGGGTFGLAKAFSWTSSPPIGITSTGSSELTTPTPTAPATPAPTPADAAPTIAGYAVATEAINTIVRAYGHLGQAQAGLITAFPSSMNGCNNQRFAVRWRTLGSAIEAGSTDSSAAIGDVLPPSRFTKLGNGSSGTMTFDGCSQPAFFSDPSAPADSLSDVAVTYWRYDPRP